MKKAAENIRLHERIVFRIFAYFAFVVCMFAILLGVIYGRMYERSTVNSFRDDLIQKAQRISKCVTNFSSTEDKAGFNAYLEAVKSIFDQNSTDVYIMSNPDSDYAMKSDYTNYSDLNLHDNSLPKATTEVLRKAFSGKIGSNSGYDAWYYGKVVRIAVPVTDAGGNISGAVMIISQPQDQEMVSSNRYMIFVSSIVALLISILVSVLFATQISGPISVMRKTALTLAEGNYDIKTQLKVKGELGQLSQSINILSDRLKENENERKSMEQMRMDFFANVSHELRTPITVIRGYTEMLADDVITDEEQKKQYYQRQLSECKSMERLVGDLLTLSKMQNPDFEIEKEPVNLVQVFQDIVRSVTVIAEKKNLKLNMKYEKENIMMMGDYDRLRQMFLVIIDNAIKFSYENSDIDISLRDGHEIKVFIQDYGTGISQEELPFIFEKFYKSKLRQNAKGSGLGLVIAKQIAIKHEGRINVKSNLGKGTLFEFTFDKIEDIML